MASPRSLLFPRARPPLLALATVPSPSCVCRGRVVRNRVALLPSERKSTVSLCRAYSQETTSPLTPPPTPPPAAPAPSKKAQWQLNAKSTTIIDELTITASGGTGGDGCVSFSREKHVRFGPPSGGSGGPGGNVYVRAEAGLRSLSRLPVHAQGGQGQGGRGDWQGGRRGGDVTLSVPIGTVVRIERLPLEEVYEAHHAAELRDEYDEALLARLTRQGKLRRIDAGVEAGGSSGSPSADSSDRDDLDDIDATPSSPTSQTFYTDEEMRRIRPPTRTKTEALLDEEEAETQQALLSSVWRHYPGASNAEAVTADPDEEVSVYSREDFRLAEERYALAMRKQRKTYSALPEQTIPGAEISTSDVVGAAEDGGSDTTRVTTVDFSEATPADHAGYLVAAGGWGGYGNPFFLTNDSRSPKYATRGRLGESVRMHLELKSPAHVGLVGLPNAGKSSLLRALTGATKDTAKVGGWEFTTLSPNVGVLRIARDGRLLGTGREPIFDSSVADADVAITVEDGDPHSDAHADPSLSEEIARYTIADLPGLIRGASHNRGLGHTFLRHAERCDTLVYVLDVSPARAAPWEDLQALRDELEGYKAGLSRKVGLVVANKCDALGPADEGAAHLHSQSQIQTQSQSQSSRPRLTIAEAQAKLRKLQDEVAQIHAEDGGGGGGGGGGDGDDGRPIPRVVPVSAMWRQGVEVVARRMADVVEGAAGGQ